MTAAEQAAKQKLSCMAEHADISILEVLAFAFQLLRNMDSTCKVQNALLRQHRRSAFDMHKKSRWWKSCREEETGP